MAERQLSPHVQRHHRRIQIRKRFQGRGDHLIERMRDRRPYALDVSRESTRTFDTLNEAKRAAREAFGVTRWAKCADATWQPLDGDCVSWGSVAEAGDHYGA